MLVDNRPAKIAGFGHVQNTRLVLDIITRLTVSARIATLRKLGTNLTFVMNKRNSHFAEKIVIRLTDYVLPQLVIIHVTIACPGRNLLLQGHAGYGRHVPMSLAVHIEECDFVSIPLASADIHDCIPMLFSLMRNVVTNAVLCFKKTIISRQSAGDAVEIPADFRAQRDFTTFFLAQRAGPTLLMDGVFVQATRSIQSGLR
jgi:hypothetical protein